MKERCHKQRFTKKEAEYALKRNKKSSKQYRKEVRYYYCRPCNAWHLTSKENEPVDNDLKNFKFNPELWSHLIDN